MYIVVVDVLQPEEDEMAEGGHDEGEEGAAGGAHQRHQLTKVRHLNNCGLGRKNKCSKE